METGNHDPLIEVSNLHIVLAILPLVAVALISNHVGLGLESPILVGTLRTFVQLSILSFILTPIFKWGATDWMVVVAYAIFMVVLAAYESSSRSKYYFKGMFWYILFTLLANVLWISLFSFTLILQPSPVWDPQYVIPIVGMILGNCINGISLSMNTMLTSMVESSNEIEILLSFGANSYESTQRLFREAVRTGTMPLLNGMAIIGIISIPGMMTGQILGGSSVLDAARYQILIMYLIAACSFSSIFSQLFFVLKICFDSRTILRGDLLFKRKAKADALTILKATCQRGIRFFQPKRDFSRGSSMTPSQALEETQPLAPQGVLRISNTGNENETITAKISLVAHDLSYAFKKKGAPKDTEAARESELDVDEEVDDQQSETSVQHRILFQGLSMKLSEGGMALVHGPSGAGKSTLLRLLAGLVAPKDESSIELFGRSMAAHNDMPQWRRNVLYVPQSKVDIPGTPFDLLLKISLFKVRQEEEGGLSFMKMSSETKSFLSDWDMDCSLLESEWKTLSGGESQRVLLALALSTMPKILLLDESTSAVDQTSKVRIEESVKKHCHDTGASAVWVTHDEGQQDRIVNSCL